MQADVPAALVEAACEAARARHEEVLVEACSTIESLAAGSAEVDAALVQAGAPAALVKAAHQSIRVLKSDTPKSAFQTLQKLAAGSDEARWWKSARPSSGRSTRGSAQAMQVR